MNILLFTLDTLRAQSMSLHEYKRLTTPHLDNLAKKSVVFNEAYSPMIPTEPAHTTLFTSRDVYAHQIIAHAGAAELDPTMPVLAEILKKNGYFTGAADILQNWYPRGFDDYLTYVWDSDPTHDMRKAEAVNETAFELFKKAKEQDKPWFIWLHYWDPHNPYKAPEPFKSMFYSFGREKDPNNHSMNEVWAFEPFREFFEAWMDGITDINHPIAQYDGEIAYMDSCIQHIFTKMEDYGFMDDTLIIVTSDHGEELNEHKQWFDHHGLYDTNLWIPLMFYYPKKLPQNKRVNGIVSLIDVAPTILELAGLDSEIESCKMEGISLVAAMTQDIVIEDRPLYTMECTWMKKRGVRTRDWKLIVEGGGTPAHFNTPDVELYDLKNDPAEIKNLAEEKPEIVAQLKEQLEDYIKQRMEETGNPDPFEYQDVTCLKNTFPKGAELPKVIKNMPAHKKAKMALRLRGLGYGGD